MNLHKLTAGTAALNGAAKKCFEKCGFLPEGIQRKQFYYQGDYIDVHLFGLLKEDWLRKQGEQVKDYKLCTGAVS